MGAAGLGGILLRLEGGNGVRIVGPATLKVREGLLMILGAELGPGSGAVIAKGRSYYVHALQDSELEVSLGADARLEQPQPGEEPLLEWVERVDEELDTCELPCTIVTLGPTDSGKTSITALIANRALLRGLKPGVIDADIGQADVGPPGFVSAGIPEGWLIWLRELGASRMSFVGHIEPSYAEARILAGILRLRDWVLSQGASVVAIDTDGWVDGWHALEAKLNILRYTNPSAVVVVGNQRLYRFVSERWPGRVLHLPSPTRAEERGPVERRRLRRDNYRRFLEEGVLREVNLRETPLLNSCISYRNPQYLQGRREIVQEYPGGVCAFYNTDTPPDPGQVRGLTQRYNVREALVVYRGGFRGVLVGLVDPEGWDHPGVVEDIDLDEAVVRVRTPYTGPIRMVVAGRIRLTEEYEDLGQRRIWL